MLSKNNFLRLLVATVVAFCFGSIRHEASSTFQNTTNERARAVLDEALKALGGIDPLKNVTSITMKGTGAEHPSAQAQGYKYGKQTGQPYQETLVAFPSQGKFAFE